MNVQNWLLRLKRFAFAPLEVSVEVKVEVRVEDFSVWFKHTIDALSYAGKFQFWCSRHATNCLLEAGRIIYAVQCTVYIKRFKMAIDFESVKRKVSGMFQKCFKNTTKIISGHLVCELDIAIRGISPFLKLNEQLNFFWIAIILETSKLSSVELWSNLALITYYKSVCYSNFGRKDRARKPVLPCWPAL